MMSWRFLKRAGPMRCSASTAMTRPSPCNCSLTSATPVLVSALAPQDIVPGIGQHAEQIGQRRNRSRDRPDALHGDRAFEANVAIFAGILNFLDQERDRRLGGLADACQSERGVFARPSILVGAE